MLTLALKAPLRLLDAGISCLDGSHTCLLQGAGLPIHPARMPPELVEFFVRFLTDGSDLVLDPFAGSNTTGAVRTSGYQPAICRK